MPFTYKLIFGDLWPSQLSEAEINRSQIINDETKRRIIELRENYFQTHNDTIHPEYFTSIDGLEEYFDNVQATIERFFERFIANPSIRIERSLTDITRRRSSADSRPTEMGRRALAVRLQAARARYSTEIGRRVDGVSTIARQDFDRLRRR